jgi:exopolysaccharide biosynthesis polyprenyl glycosylphosphotransferase
MVDTHERSTRVGGRAADSTAVLAGPELVATTGTVRTKWQAGYSARLAVTDTLVVCGAVAIAQYLRFGSDVTWRPYQHTYVFLFSVVFAAGWLIVLSAFRTRSPRIIGTGIEEYRRVVSASLWIFGAIAIISLLLKADVARGYLAVALPGGTLGLVLSRALWRRYVQRQRANGGYLTSVLVVGERDVVVQTAKEMSKTNTDGYRVVGVCIPGYGPPRGETIYVCGRQTPIVGDEEYLLRAIPICGADTVAVTGTECFGARGIRRLAWNLEPLGVDLVVSTGIVDVAMSRLTMRPSAALPLLHVEKPQYRGAKRFSKRAFDMSFAFLALTVAAPLMLAAAAAIKLTSKGPVFYSAERIGLDGKPFSMLKFRTMVQYADTQIPELLSHNDNDGVLFKIRDDPRVTPVGKILRRASIDELPQFINVLRNDMSVVGPRPPLRREVDAYEDDVLHRLVVKPGISGLWQVSGRSDLSWEESVRLDLYYVDNWSMVVDLVIIAKTLRAVLARQGAY